MLPMRRVSQPGVWFNRGPSSERTDLPGCRGRQISNPQPNPQFVVSCTSYGYFGSPRVLVCCCKTVRRCPVTAEVASSSLVVPAILSKALVLISAKPSRTQKGTFSCPFMCPFSRAIFSPCRFPHAATAPDDDDCDAPFASGEHQRQDGCLSCMFGRCDCLGVDIQCGSQS